MRANTFVGQVITVLSRRASAFELDSSEPQTFPGRLGALLSHHRRINTAPRTPADDDQMTIIEKTQAETPETALFTSRHDPPPGQQSPEARETPAFEALRIRAHELKHQSPHDRLGLRRNLAFPAIARLLDRNRRDLALASDLARNLTRNLTRDLAHALGSDLARAHDVAHALTHALTRDLDLTRDLTRDLTHAVARDLTRALTRDLDLDLARDLTRARVFVLVYLLDPTDDLHSRLADLGSVLADLDDALHDFTKADLRNVDLTGVQLEGLRWSLATQWPADWTTQVERDSVEVAPDVFEVREGDRMYAPTSV